MGAVTSAILLAAGESTRMGRPKQLLPWGGVTLIEWQIGQLLEAGASSVIAVLGSQAEELMPLVAAAGGLAVINHAHLEGRASSLRTGAAALKAAGDRVVVLSVDQPRPAWVTSRLLAQSVETSALIAIPRHSGHGGHPIVLDASLLPELGAVAEESFGLRALTERHRTDTVRLEFENPCVIVDLNTPFEYESALAAFARGEWDEDFDGGVSE